MTSEYGTFNIIYIEKENILQWIVTIILWLVGLIIISFPSVYGLLIAIYYPSEIDCLQHVDISKLLFYILIASAINFAVAIILYFAFMAKLGNNLIFKIMIAIISVVVIALSIIGWIEYYSIFHYNCLKVPIPILLAAVAVFTLPLLIPVTYLKIYYDIDIDFSD